jgi:pantothenate kinase
LRFGRTGANLATRVSRRGLDKNRKELTMIIFVGGKPKASKKAATKAAKTSSKKKPRPSKKPSKAKPR